MERIKSLYHSKSCHSVSLVVILLPHLDVPHELGEVLQGGVVLFHRFKIFISFSVIYIIVINLSSLIFFLGQLNIYKLLFIYPFAKFVTPHELPHKYRKKRSPPKNH